jgi:hypothetical protein
VEGLHVQRAKKINVWGCVGEFCGRKDKHTSISKLVEAERVGECVGKFRRVSPCFSTLTANFLRKRKSPNSLELGD